MICTSDDLRIDYYKADSSIITWQGICPVEHCDDDEYLITGTLTTGFGAIYKGKINVPDPTKIKTVKFPNSTSTSVYGPELISHYFWDDTITLVGSYQTEDVGITEPCLGFGYEGKYNDLDNPHNYFTIKPDISSKFTVVHSTRNGLAVYISSNESQLNFTIGKSFIFDIHKKKTVTQVLFPDSVFTTTYGIWHNRTCGCFDTYTIAGGFSKKNILNIQTFVVDLQYNKYTGEIIFENWTELTLPEKNILSHAQGITGLKNGHYALPLAIFYLDQKSNKIIKKSGARIEIKRENNKFVLVECLSVNFPESILTIVTSAAQNSVVGVSIDKKFKSFSFQANIN